MSEIDNFIKENNITLSNMQRIRLQASETACSLCKKCMRKKDTMLCPGVIEVVDIEQSKEYGLLMFTNYECSKYKDKKEIANLDSKLVDACIPKTVLELSKKVSFDIPKPKLMRVNPSTDATRKLLVWLYKLLLDGKDVRYINAPWLFAQEWELRKQYLADLELFDIVVVDRVDTLIGTEYDRERLFTALSMRALEMKPTIVTIGKAITGKSDYENDFFDEVRTWQVLNV